MRDEHVFPLVSDVQPFLFLILTMYNERMEHEIFSTITSNMLSMSTQNLTFSSPAADFSLVQREAWLPH